MPSWQEFHPIVVAFLGLPTWDTFKPFIVTGLALGGVYALSESGRAALVTFAHALEELAEEAVTAVAEC